MVAETAVARPRTPTNVLRLRGAFRRNPQRARRDPEPAGELGEPPAHLTELELACWRELVAMSAPGVLTAGDRWMVEIAARLMAEYRSGAEFRPARLTRLHSALAALGLSPSDRSKVIPTKPEQRENDPWNDI